MATYVQRWSGGNTSTANTQLTLPVSGAAPGNLLVAMVVLRMENSVDNIDSGNYQRISQELSGSTSSAIFWRRATGTDEDNFDASWGPGGSRSQLQVQEYSGLQNSNPVDKFVTAPLTSQPLQMGPLTPDTNDTLAISFGGVRDRSQWATGNTAAQDEISNEEPGWGNLQVSALANSRPFVFTQDQQNVTDLSPISTSMVTTQNGGIAVGHFVLFKMGVGDVGDEVEAKGDAQASSATGTGRTATDVNDVVHTLRAVGGDYSLMSAWEAGEQRDLDALNQTETLLCYNDWPGGLNDQVFISNDWNTAPDNFITIKAADGNEAKSFDLSDGFHLVASPDVNESVLRPECGHIYIEHIGIASLTAHPSIYTNRDGISINLTGLFMQGRGNQSQGRIFRAPAFITGRIRNCATDLRVSGGGTNQYACYLDSFSIQGALRFENCTFVATGASGGQGAIVGQNTGRCSNIEFYNCVVYHPGSRSWAANMGTEAVNRTHNSAHDGFAVGTSAQYNLASSELVDYANGDFRPAPDGRLDGSGVDRSSEFTDDILKQTRTVPWDRGAWKAEAAIPIVQARGSVNASSASGSGRADILTIVEVRGAAVAGPVTGTGEIFVPTEIIQGRGTVQADPATGTGRVDAETIVGAQGAALAGVATGTGEADVIPPVDVQGDAQALPATGTGSADVSGPIPAQGDGQADPASSTGTAIVSVRARGAAQAGPATGTGEADTPVTVFAQGSTQAGLAVGSGVLNAAGNVTAQGSSQAGSASANGTAYGPVPEGEYDIRLRNFNGQWIPINNHANILGKALPDQHPIEAITNLKPDLESRTVAGYGGITQQADAGITIGAGWTTVPAEAGTFADPLLVTQDPDNDGIALDVGGVWSLSVYLSLEHNESNQGREFSLRVFNATDGVELGSGTTFNVARNQGGSNFAVSIPVEVPASGVGDLLVFQVGGTSDSFSGVIVENFLLNATHMSGGVSPQIGADLPDNTILELELESQTDPVSGFFEFNIPPGNYRELIFDFQDVTSDDADDLDNVLVSFNGDENGDNYHRQRHDVTNGGGHDTSEDTTEATGARLALLIPAVQSQPSACDVKLRVPNPSAAVRRMAFGESNVFRQTANVYQAMRTLTHDTMQDPLTVIKFESAQATTLFGTCRMYGKIRADEI